MPIQAWTSCYISPLFVFPDDRRRITARNRNFATTRTRLQTPSQPPATLLLQSAGSLTIPGYQIIKYTVTLPFSLHQRYTELPLGPRLRSTTHTATVLGQVLKQAEIPNQLIMAANEYYSDRPSSRYSRQNSDLPRPRLPPPSPSYSAYKPSNAETIVSPITDSFDEPTYPAHNQRNQQALGVDSMYRGAGVIGDRDANPYADDIPLRPRPPPKDSEEQRGQDPRRGYSNEDGSFVGSAKHRDPESRQRRRRSGMFRGKIPWVVYILTLIQVSVFIAELAKNGEQEPLGDWAGCISLC